MKSHVVYLWGVVCGWRGRFLLGRCALGLVPGLLIGLAFGRRWSGARLRVGGVRRSRRRRRIGIGGPVGGLGRRARGHAGGVRRGILSSRRPLCRTGITLRFRRPAIIAILGKELCPFPVN